MNTILQSLWRFLCAAKESPKTTAAGVAAVVGGVTLISKSNYTEGITSMILGLGMFAAMDGKSTTCDLPVKPDSDKK